MALYLKYRPQTLDEIRGNEEAVTALRGFLADPESCPHVFLLSGPTGCGKTTLARILARELGCVGGDLREIDTADFRGIDTIRAIRRQSEFLPMEGRARGWIIDECFSGDTLVSTPEGVMAIRDVRVGDVVISLDGPSVVEHVFVNRVPLDHLVRVDFDDGRTVFTTKWHRFLTTLGWKEAGALDLGDLFFCDPHIHVFSLSQGGCGGSCSTDCCGGRWEEPSVERGYIERSKEGGEVTAVGVAGVTFYERGRTDEAFVGIVGDKERDCGFVTFYDLQVSGHPSYFANGVPVHNCHKLTGDGQSALLKFLEDTPAHVYVFLCTTDPQKLLPTIRGRCSELTVQPLTEVEMIRLLRSVAKAEGVKLSRPIYQQIAVNSLGHPRNALQILEQVIRVPEDQRAKVAERVAAEQSQTIELCRALLRGAAWKQVAGILKGLEGQDPEGIRRQVMGYFKSVLLGGENDLAAAILEVFVEPFYDSGWPGLVLACYTAVRGE